MYGQGILLLHNENIFIHNYFSYLDNKYIFQVSNSSPNTYNISDSNDEYGYTLNIDYPDISYWSFSEILSYLIYSYWG